MIVLHCKTNTASAITAAQASCFPFADLPADLQLRIFTSVFPTDQPLPLMVAARQHVALQLTCKSWRAAALQQLTLAVETCLPPPASVRWLHEHAAVLHLLSPQWHRYEKPAGVPRYDGGNHMLHWIRDWVERRCGPPNGGALWYCNGGPDGIGNAAFEPCNNQYQLYIDLLMEGCSHAPQWRLYSPGATPGAPLLALAACSNLEVRGRERRCLGHDEVLTMRVCLHVQ